MIGNSYIKMGALYVMIGTSDIMLRKVKYEGKNGNIEGNKEKYWKILRTVVGRGNIVGMIIVPSAVRPSHRLLG